MIDYSHNFKSSEYIPYSGENIIKPITIGAHVWIGYGAIILPGVSIGEGAIIGAGAVVTRSIPECGIAIGNPARVIAKRDVAAFNSLKEKKSSHYLLTKNR
jgi:acetyltransferase-like isoleucine patch superfamily enzyme